MSLLVSSARTSKMSATVSQLTGPAGGVRFLLVVSTPLTKVGKPEWPDGEGSSRARSHPVLTRALFPPCRMGFTRGQVFRVCGTVSA